MTLDLAAGTLTFNNASLPVAPFSVDQLEAGPITLNGVLRFDAVVVDSNSGNLGELTISGADTSVLGTVFQPVTELVIGDGSLGGEWNASINGVAIKLDVGVFQGSVQRVKLSYGSVVFDESFDNIISQSLYHYRIRCGGSLAVPDCGKISFSIPNRQVDFDNVELVPDVEGGGLINLATGSIVVNGTLFWE